MKTFLLDKLVHRKSDLGEGIIACAAILIISEDKTFFFKKEFPEATFFGKFGLE